MARHKLENELIAIEVEEHGAELKSLVRKNTGKEYMWKADPKFWGRTSPVLFPFVGAVKDKQFRTKGQTYTMGQHGFARDMDFTLDSQTEDTLWFVLKSNEETMAKYPYAFTLRIGYHIEENKLEVLWQVENPSEEELPFSIGGHPAFNRPKNCKIRFDVAGPLTSTTIVDGLVGNGTVDYELKNSYLTVTDHLFDDDALVIENQNVHEVSLCDMEGNPYLTVTMDAPLFGVLVIWVAICVFVFDYTKFGRREKFVGGNPICAQLSGIKYNTYAILGFLLAGVGVGIGAFMTLVYTPSVTTTTAGDIGMNIMVAIVFGGMPISGGARSKIYAAVVGGFSYIVLNNILDLLIDSTSGYGITQIVSAVFFLIIVYVASVNYRSQTLPR